MTDKIQYGIEFDTAEAKAALDKLKAQLDKISSPKVQRAGGLDALNKQLNELRGKAVAAGSALTAALGAGATKVLATLKTALVAATAAAAGLAAGLGAALKKGLGDNTAMEGYQASIATTVAQLYEFRDAQGELLTGQELNAAAAAEATRRLDELQKAASQAGYASKDLAAALEMGLAKGGLNAIDADSVQKLVEDLVVGARSVGAAGGDLVNEVRALFNGEGLEGSKMAKALAITPQTLESWKAQGTLAAELGKRLREVRAGAEGAGQDMDQLTGRLSTGISNSLQQASAGAYATLKKALGGALDELFDPSTGEVAQKFRGIYTLVERLFTSVGESIAESIKGALETLEGVSAWLDENESAVASLGDSFEGMARSIKSVASGILGISKATTDSSKAADLLGRTFKGLELIVAGISDIVKTLAGSLGWAAGKIGEFAASAGAALANKLGAKGVATDLEGLANAAGNLAKGGEELAKSGLGFEQTVRTLEEGTARVAQELVDSMKVVDATSKRVEKRNGAKAPGATKAIATATPAQLAAQKAAAEAEKRAAEAIEAARVQAARQAFADEQALLAQKLDAQVQLSLISKRDEIAARQKLEADALAQEMNQAKALREKLSKQLTPELDATASGAIKAQLVAIDAQISSLTSKEQRIKLKAELDSQLLDKQVAAMRASIQAQIDQLKGLSGEDLQAQRSEMLKDSLVQSDAELQALVAQLFDGKEIQARFDAAAARVAQINADLARAEADIERSYSTGMTTALERETQLRDLRRESAEALRDSVKAMEEAAGASGNSALVEQAKDAAAAMEDVKAKTVQLNQQGVENLKSAFAAAFRDIAQGAKSAGDVLLDLLVNVLGQIANKWASIGLDSITKGWAGSSGGGWLSSIFGGAFATGGLIRGPGTGTSDSVPILASNGEFVVNAAATKKNFALLNYLNGSGSLPKFATGGAIGDVQGMQAPTLQSNVNVSPQVVIQTGTLIDGLNSDPRFERTIVQLVQANKVRLGY